jgi:hypothetical protein
LLSSSTLVLIIEVCLSLFLHFVFSSKMYPVQILFFFCLVWWYLIVCFWFSVVIKLSEVYVNFFITLGLDVSMPFFLAMLLEPLDVGLQNDSFLCLRTACLILIWFESPISEDSFLLSLLVFSLSCLCVWEGIIHFGLRYLLWILRNII